MNKVRIRSAAIADAEEAVFWYESQRADLGVEFILELDSALHKAAEEPKAYQDIYLDVRRVLMQRFPYAVYFVFENEVVEVIAILHQHQSPTVWQSRV